LDSYVIRLAANPSLPRQSVSPKKRIVVTFVFFAGLLIFTLIAFMAETFTNRKQ